MKNIYFQKVRKVKSPSKANDTDAGIDFYVPEDVYEILNRNERVKIPSGIKVKLPKGYCLAAFNKSGVSSNLGLDKLAEIVDEEYQGEIHLVVFNSSDDRVIIESGMKLMQFLLLPVPSIKLIQSKNIHKIITKRNICGFGSTGI